MGLSWCPFARAGLSAQLSCAEGSGGSWPLSPTVGCTLSCTIGAAGGPGKSWGCLLGMSPNGLLGRHASGIEGCGCIDPDASTLQNHGLVCVFMFCILRGA